MPEVVVPPQLSEQIVHDQTGVTIERAIAAFTAEFEEDAAPNTQKKYRLLLGLKASPSNQRLCHDRPVDTNGYP